MVHPNFIHRDKSIFPQRSRDHAVVIGASMAGLLAARVLSDYFRQVTLIERDHFTIGAEHRKGVSQDRHLHLLQLRGQEILVQLFPGLETKLTQAGAIKLDLSKDLLWYQQGGYKLRYNSGITALCMSRPLLEFWVRCCVLAIPNLICLQQCYVQSLVANESCSRVIGVKLRRQTEGGREETLEADLIVDASGRNSKTPRWLEEIGYPRPKETVIKIGVGYTSRIYKQTPEALPGAQAIYTPPVPPVSRRGGGLFPIEGGRWIVTLAGWLGDHAPADEQGFMDYVKSLASQDLYNTICRAEPLSPFVTHQFPSSLRRHYEQMTRFPEGYLVMGDAICSFNPVYGQGMSASAMEADALNQCLKQTSQRNTLHNLARNFFNKAAEAISNPWTITVGEDFRFPEVEGAKPIGTDLINWYVGHLHQTALRDPEALRALLQVMTMTHSPKTLFKPSILLRVVKDHLGHKP